MLTDTATPTLEIETPRSALEIAAHHPAVRMLSFASRMLLAIVFLTAGASKIGALMTFGHSIAMYEILPESLSNIAALLFVWTEIVVGVMLFAGSAVRGNALVSAAMLMTFLIAIVSAIARGMDIDCGCFAGAPEPVGLKKVLEDVGLLAAAIFLVYFPKSYLSIDTLIRRWGEQ